MGIKWDEQSESEPGQTVWSALVSFEAFCTCLEWSGPVTEFHGTHEEWIDSPPKRGYCMK